MSEHSDDESQPGVILLEEHAARALEELSAEQVHQLRRVADGSATLTPGVASRADFRTTSPQHFR